MIDKIRLRFRSVSFRAGLATALIVTVIVAPVLILIAATAEVSGSISTDPNAAPEPVASAQLVSVLFAIGLSIMIATASGVITAWTVNRSLRRVARIQTEVQQISSASLHRRLSTRDIADPVDRLPHTMNAMLDRLERAQRQQNQFIADASHELRSPVAGLLAQLDVAQHYPDKVDVHELMPRLHKETVRTHTLIEDLLFLSRLDGDARTTRETLTLPAAIEVISAQLERTKHHQSGVSISFDRSQTGSVEPDSNLVVWATENELARVIQNVVGNACRHAETRVAVTLTAAPWGPHQRQLTLLVTDDGPGIAESDRSRVFDRFVRLDEARDRDQGGSGLGLAITKELVAQMGGMIEVVEPVDRQIPGANFMIRIPLTNPETIPLASSST